MKDIDVIHSWNFWSLFFEKHPEKLELVPGYTWPGTASSYWNAVKRSGHNFCPSCRGRKMLEWEQPQEANGFEFKRIYCVCTMSYMFDLPWENIESSYEKKRLSEIKYWDDPKGAAERTKEIVTEAVRFIKYPSDWVFLHGGYGSGKTHIGNAIKTAMGGMALYITMADLNQRVFTALREQMLDTLTDVVSNAPVLILDDVGAEYPSPFFYATLFSIINTRYARKRLAPTFITSNLTPRDLMNSTEQNYQRIGDRMRDTGLVIPLVSIQESFRGR